MKVARTAFGLESGRVGTGFFCVDEVPLFTRFEPLLSVACTKLKRRRLCVICNTSGVISAAKRAVYATIRHKHSLIFKYPGTQRLKRMIAIVYARETRAKRQRNVPERGTMLNDRHAKAEPLKIKALAIISAFKGRSVNPKKEDK
jgi:hypothetical protein